jgi:hypothetical protein
VKAALQHGYFLAIQGAEQQAAGVALYRRNREIGDVSVADFVLDFHFPRQCAQASAEDDACSRLEVIGVGLNVGDGFGEGRMQLLARFSNQIGDVLSPQDTFTYRLTHTSFLFLL